MIELIHGDCIEKMRELPENSVDSIVTDPPYELGFMGKSWDNTGIANSKEMWREAMRVLKPGGHLLAFSGTRTYHRMAVAIEDAGFEVRDMIEWVYGSGFPKSLNIGKAMDGKIGKQSQGFSASGDDGRKAELKQNLSFRSDYGYKFEPTSDNAKQWEGWGTALKPAHEPICMARKPLAEKTVAENVLKYGTGGINIDVSRVSSDTDAYKNDDNNESIVPLHKLSELRHKLHTLSLSFLADKKDYLIPASADEYEQRWKAQLDCRDDCLICRGLYDALFPLFLKDDQVSFQQLRDAHACISRFQQEPNDTPCNQGIDHLSSLDDFSQLILSYFNDTTPDIKKQENMARFPANLIHDNSEEVRGCFPETKSGWTDKDKQKSNSMFLGEMDYTGTHYADNSGNASRFFKSIIYQAKASKSERNRGCEGLGGEVRFASESGSGQMMPTKLDKPHKIKGNAHPTIKPIALMSYLIKMVTPKGGTVLDPFMGSGSTGVAAKENGYGFIGIDMTAEYIVIAKKRIYDNE